MSSEIDEGSFGGYSWGGGETADSCSLEEMPRGLPKLASSLKTKGTALSFSFLMLVCFGDLKVLIQLLKYGKKRKTHLLSTYHMSKRDPGQSIALKAEIIKLGVLRQPWWTRQFTASSSLCAVFFLIGH